MAMVGKAFVTITFSVVYVHSSELFPTEIRHVGLGTASMWARVGSMIAPYMGAPLVSHSCLSVCLSGSHFPCLCCLFFLLFYPLSPSLPLSPLCLSLSLYLCMCPSVSLCLSHSFSLCLSVYLCLQSPSDSLFPQGESVRVPVSRFHYLPLSVCLSLYLSLSLS